MAFEVKRINPIDLEPRKAVGVKVPFSGKAVFNSTYETKEAIKSNLINFLLTGKGERYLNPTFGSGIRNLLFENINRNTTEQVEFILQESLRTYFPNLSISNIEINSNTDKNTLSFNLQYQLKNTQVEDEITINFES